MTRTYIFVFVVTAIAVGLVAHYTLPPGHFDPRPLYEQLDVYERFDMVGLCTVSEDVDEHVFRALEGRYFPVSGSGGHGYMTIAVPRQQIARAIKLVEADASRKKYHVWWRDDLYGNAPYSPQL